MKWDILENDDDVDTLESLFEFAPDAAGRYFICVEHWDYEYGVGSYDISVSIIDTETEGLTADSNTLMEVQNKSDAVPEPVKVDFVVEPTEREPKNK